MEWSPHSRELVLESEQIFSGISVSPGFESVVYITPGGNGSFQLWRVRMSGGQPEQLAFDPRTRRIRRTPR